MPAISLKENTSTEQSVIGVPEKGAVALGGVTMWNWDDWEYNFGNGSWTFLNCLAFEGFSCGMMGVRPHDPHSKLWCHELQVFYQDSEWPQDPQVQIHQSVVRVRNWWGITCFIFFLFGYFFGFAVLSLFLFLCRVLELEAPISTVSATFWSSNLSCSIVFATFWCSKCSFAWYCATSVGFIWGWCRVYLRLT